MAHHTRAWQRYSARRKLKPKERVSCDGCNTQYCVPDTVHNDYVYTPAWVEFLIKKLSNEKDYHELTSRQAASGKA